jgi:carbon monoxide dehydrogenase subunit G
MPKPSEDPKVELVNEFRVPASVDQAWEVLTDVERIAPCIPGAQLLGVDGDDFTGAVKVKVGPITVQYKGKASFEQKDESGHRAVIRANGKETRGQGNAAAVVTAELKDEGDSTSCVLTTDLTISGKAAQFGRGVLSDVATKLIRQFAERLEADLLAASAVSSSGETPVAPLVSAATPDDVASVDVLSVVAVPVAKRVLPIAAGLAVGMAIGFVFGRRRS